MQTSLKGRKFPRMLYRGDEKLIVFNDRQFELATAKGWEVQPSNGLAK